MPLPKNDIFLNQVLSHVKFKYDREDIRKELESHMGQRMDDYLEEGHDLETAQELTISRMGDPTEIGKELNKEHNPLLGYLWLITKNLVILLLIPTVYICGAHLFRLFYNPKPIDIPKSDIIYHMKLNEKVRIDDTFIHFTDVIYDKNSDLSIIYKYYDVRLWGSGWSFSSIGNITDNLGNTYVNSTGSSNGGIVSKSRHTINKFSEKADTLIITYDSYNRYYQVIIPLEVGDNNE